MRQDPYTSTERGGAQKRRVLEVRIASDRSLDEAKFCAWAVSMVIFVLLNQFELRIGSDHRLQCKGWLQGLLNVDVCANHEVGCRK
jgi:hypothetical protein